MNHADMSSFTIDEIRYVLTLCACSLLPSSWSGDHKQFY